MTETQKQIMKWLIGKPITFEELQKQMTGSAPMNTRSELRKLIAVRRVKEEADGTYTRSQPPMTEIVLMMLREDGNLTLEELVSSVADFTQFTIDIALEEKVELAAEELVSQDIIAHDIETDKYSIINNSTKS